MLVPRKHHVALIGSNGATYRKLRNEFNIVVDHKGEPEPKANKKTGALNGSAARIDTTEGSEDFNLEIIENQGSEEEGDITWVLKGDQKNIDRAQKYIKNLLKDAVSIFISSMYQTWVCLVLTHVFHFPPHSKTKPTLDTSLFLSPCIVTSLVDKEPPFRASEASLTQTFSFPTRTAKLWWSLVPVQASRWPET